MKEYIVEPTVSTPYIYFDGELGILEIKGRSLPDNPKEIFDYLINKVLEDYVKNPLATTKVNISLEYFNTSTSMWLFHLFKKLENLVIEKFTVEVNWYCDDYDIYETADEFKSVINIPFNLIRT